MGYDMGQKAKTENETLQDGARKISSSEFLFLYPKISQTFK